ncbi:RsmD family RNA methyltransferase [Odoribacter lunatus]|uniref:RsmD family RNA methyltransferase n=1 Tax=Odoribacter lunatus TaxID=2941335 RepID=UPI002040E92E|nr:RsmD family RNA methyltransferase [Odoribacter lunatus]
MRIISGSHRGRQIFPDKNFAARPTTDFAKENIFNVLNNYVDFEDAVALDLFSGTGSISYEFASRGAKEVIAVELNYNHYSFIKRTAQEIGFKNITVFKTDVFVACKKLRGRKFNIIFADPPYQLDNISEVPAAIFDNDLLAEEGIALVEHPASVDYSHLPYFFDHRVYGSVNFSLFRK